MEGRVEECRNGGGWLASGVVGAADAFRVEADGVLSNVGSSSLGIVVGGRRSSE